MWRHQHGSFGHKGISDSRRGHQGSGTGPPHRPGTSAGDLVDLLNVLGINRAHVVGTALGGFTAIDFALTDPSRLLSLAVSSSLCGITDEIFVADTRRLVPPSWHRLPSAGPRAGPELPGRIALRDR